MGLGFLLGFPIIFMVLIGLAFGRPGLEILDIGVVNEDKTPISAAFLDGLKQAPNLKITAYETRAEAEEGVRLEREAGYIIIPQGFGVAVNQRMKTGEGKIPLIVGYDPTTPGLGPPLDSIINFFALSFFKIEIPIALEKKVAIREVKSPMMNWIVPSMIVFGLMILLSATTSRIGIDRFSGVLTRINTTPVRPWELVISYSLPFILVGIASIFIYLAVGILLGLEILGSLPLTFLLYLMIAILFISWGMIVASLVKTIEQGQALPWLLIIPLCAISGLWFPIEGMPGYMKTFAGIFPIKYAGEASRDIINRAGDLRW